MTPAEYKAEQARLATQLEQYLQTSIIALPTLAEAMAVSAVVIAAGNLTSRLYADAMLSRLLRTMPLGLGRPEGDVVRIESALIQIVEESKEDPMPRMVRLARSEPIDAGRLATTQAMKTHRIRQYRWELDNPDPCDICRHNAAHLFPVKQLPVSHPSCTCMVMPVTKEK